MYRIILAEDQNIVRQGLKMIIEQDPELKVVGEATTGSEAIERLETTVADMILMDVRMPVMNGIEATQKIKKRWPKVKIVILTTFNDEEYAMEALKEGASGFLLKTSDGEKLIYSIRSCLEGGVAIHEQVAAKVLPKLLQRQIPQPVKMTLTPREIAITHLIGEGKANKEIAGELYISVGTVKNHITNILEKLELRDRTQLAIFAVKQNV
ncbi:response regulator transcription factor [Bacillaceae bacterium Marseille-Q3522]|nr:response regulator transcription factor [Bacillaceae bacterium Marseille-Q3522]